MKKVLFLINPVSGEGQGRSINDEIIDGMTGLVSVDQYDVTITRPNLSGQLEEAAQHYEAVVVAGGDGSISRVVDVVAGMKRKPKIGLIPAGTGNDLARSLGIWPVYRKGGVAGLLRMILRGRTAAVDVMQLNGNTLFANYFGMGIDARIAQDFDEVRKRPFYQTLCSYGLGKVLYGFLGLRALTHRIRSPITLRYKSRRWGEMEVVLPGNICQVLVTGVKTYAGGMVLSSRNSMNDGRFEVTVIPGVRQWFTMHMSRVFRKPFDVFYPDLVHFQTDSLEMRFEGAACCQVDGEVYAPQDGSEHCIAIKVYNRVEMLVP